jgi:hypothetical protein
MDKDSLVYRRWILLCMMFDTRVLQNGKQTFLHYGENVSFEIFSDTVNPDCIVPFKVPA